MKAILEFNLPEDLVEFELASNAYRYRSALKDIAESLRQRYKYDADKYSDIELDLIGKIADEFYDILHHNRIDDESL